MKFFKEDLIRKDETKSHNGLTNINMCSNLNTKSGIAIIFKRYITFNNKLFGEDPRYFYAITVYSDTRYLNNYIARYTTNYLTKNEIKNVKIVTKALNKMIEMIINDKNDYDIPYFTLRVIAHLFNNKEKYIEEEFKDSDIFIKCKLKDLI